jgi:hypothetical protein
MTDKLDHYQVVIPHPAPVHMFWIQGIATSSTGHICIYVYIYREREREGDLLLVQEEDLLLVQEEEREI